MHVACRNEWANCPTLGCVALDLVELYTFKKASVRWVSHRRPHKPCWGVFFASVVFTALVCLVVAVGRT